MSSRHFASSHFRARVSRPRAIAISGLLCAITLQFGELASAQENSKPIQSGRARVVEKFDVPKPEVLTLIVRTAILTLNDAIETGNFTVLRDKGSRAFRARFSAAHLSLTFHDLLRDQADLSSIAVTQIQLIDKPIIDAQNMLRVSGTFKTLKGPFRFDLLFEPSSGKWRVTGISVHAQKEVAQTSGSANKSGGKAPIGSQKGTAK